MLGAYRFHQSANAQNTHYPFHVVGQDVQRHFGTDVLECFHLEVCGPHPGLYRTEGMLHSLAAEAHFHRVSIEPRVDGLELAAIDRNARLAEQLKASSQHHELAADLADGLAIVLAEIGYRLEVRHQTPGQPHQLDVALALPLQAPARLHPINTKSLRA